VLSVILIFCLDSGNKDNYAYDDEPQIDLILHIKKGEKNTEKDFKKGQENQDQRLT
jgi:hypothetical protein